MYKIIILKKSCARVSLKNILFDDRFGKRTGYREYNYIINMLKPPKKVYHTTMYGD